MRKWPKPRQKRLRRVHLPPNAPWRELSWRRRRASLTRSSAWTVSSSDSPWSPCSPASPVSCPSPVAAPSAVLCWLVPLSQKIHPMSQFPPQQKVLVYPRRVPSPGRRSSGVPRLLHPPEKAVIIISINILVFIPSLNKLYTFKQRTMCLCLLVFSVVCYGESRGVRSYTPYGMKLKPISQLGKHSA